MAAVLQENNVETVYDHGITDDEQLNLFGYVEDEAMYAYSLSNDFALSDLYRLYLLRNNHKKAQAFLNKIQSSSVKTELTRVSCCDSSVCSQLLRDNSQNLLIVQA